MTEHESAGIATGGSGDDIGMEDCVRREEDESLSS